ncbi:MAG TPA: hypothetical protein DCG54_09640 [Anaerolineae bacterium]|jgi:hypothetical protein|nr:hypothetical protein [Anaerolineae bacterium]
MITDSTESLRIYCAMWPERAEALLTVKNGFDINQMTMAAFRSNGLVDYGGQLTSFGKDVAERVDAIMLGRFEAPQGSLSGIVKVQLEQIDIRQLCRGDTCKSHGLKAVHIKALRSIALYPGQAFNTLDQVYGYDTLRDLSRAEFIRCADWRKYDQVWPTAKADAFLLALASTEFMAHVGQPA